MRTKMLQSRRRWKIIESSFYNRRKRLGCVKYNRKEGRKRRIWEERRNIMMGSKYRHRRRQWRRTSIAISWWGLRGGRSIMLGMLWIVGLVKRNLQWTIMLMMMAGQNWPKSSVRKTIWRELCTILQKLWGEVDIITKVLLINLIQILRKKHNNTKHLKSLKDNTDGSSVHSVHKKFESIHNSSNKSIVFLKLCSFRVICWRSWRVSRRRSL